MNRLVFTILVILVSVVIIALLIFIITKRKDNMSSEKQDFLTDPNVQSYIADNLIPPPVNKKKSGLCESYYDTCYPVDDCFGQKDSRYCRYMKEQNENFKNFGVVTGDFANPLMDRNFNTRIINTESQQVYY